MLIQYDQLGGAKTRVCLSNTINLVELRQEYAYPIRSTWWSQHKSMLIQYDQLGGAKTRVCLSNMINLVEPTQEYAYPI